MVCSPWNGLEKMPLDPTSSEGRSLRSCISEYCWRNEIIPWFLQKMQRFAEDCIVSENVESSTLVTLLLLFSFWGRVRVRAAVQWSPWLEEEGSNCWGIYQGSECPVWSFNNCSAAHSCTGQVLVHTVQYYVIKMIQNSFHISQHWCKKQKACEPGSQKLFEVAEMISDSIDMHFFALFVFSDMSTSIRTSNYLLSDWWLRSGKFV